MIDAEPSPTQTRLERTPPPSLALVILLYQSADYVGPCLRSVAKLQLPPDELIVVDNASTDGSPEAVLERFPEVRLIRNAEPAIQFPELRIHWTTRKRAGSSYFVRSGREAFILVSASATDQPPNAILRRAKMEATPMTSGKKVLSAISATFAPSPCT